MSEKEAIEILCNTPFLATEENSTKLEDAIRTAVYALEKSIPKQPYAREDLFGKCPFCEDVVLKVNKFCDQCGQALDWGEDDQNGEG